MLVSHSKKFIYLKTLKTGGTSVEIFLEPYCLPPDMGADERHHRPAIVSEAGIVGARGPFRTRDSAWFNHMAASEVKAKLGAGVWDAYLKFCVVRNPFDKLVSFWWMQVAKAPAATQDRAVRDLAYAREELSSWVLEAPELPTDRHIYAIDGVPIVDRFLRHESLDHDLAALCAELGIAEPTRSLGRYKSGYRRRPEPFQAYFTPEARHRVEIDFAVELAENRYDFT